MLRGGDPMPSSKWTDEHRDQVLAQVRAGTSYRDIEAATGVSRATIGRWAEAAGIEVAGAEQVSNAVNATKLAWAQRRGDLVDEAGARATQALERISTATEAREAKDWAVTFAVLVDKAQLLSGGVTSRHEQLGLERQRERIAAMGDELAERRAAKDGTTGG